MSDAARPFRVLKFGGTSVGTEESIGKAVEATAGQLGSARPVLVVSAVGGTTDTLIAAAEAAARDEEYGGLLDGMTAEHRRLVEALVAEGERQSVIDRYLPWWDELESLLHGVSLVGECTARTLDRVLSFGELMSSVLMAAALRNRGVDAVACDAREVVVTDASHGGARVDQKETSTRVRSRFTGDGPVPVVTGFIAATPDGDTTTLGRGGSDYTAAMLGAMLDADRVEIWTDVDGVMSADPRRVPDAFSLAALSYDELMELSHFGARVVHAPSVHPARAAGVPLVIRNTLRPDFGGTRVGRAAAQAVPSRGPVRGIASIGRTALLRLEGDGMVGVSGVAHRLFGALARSGINVILISQASSEHSICLAVDSEALESARRCVSDEFALEREVGLVDELVVEDGMSILAAVGEAMRETPGIAGRLFSVLGRAGINVRAIAQGSSELNISLVVSNEDEGKGLRALHAAFFGGASRPLRLYLAGIGGVGSALVGQLAERADALRVERGLEVRIAGVANSGAALLDDDGLALDVKSWRDALSGSAAAPGTLVEAALGAPGPRVFVDCTASDAVPAEYRRLLEAGVSVVAANKRAFADSLDVYQGLRQSARSQAALEFETTVGAGLPVLSTIADLVATGDDVLALEGVLSGTLALVFDEVMKGRAFSEVVREAHALGFTEPDPRDDLLGMDVARKAIIAGRVAGFPLDWNAVTVTPVLEGDHWSEYSVEELLEKVSALDAPLEARRRSAAAEGKRLCYLARVEPGAATVGIEIIGPEHPCHGLRGTDSLLSIRSRRYASPIVVRGAGAGPELTAAGVFADILTVWRGTRHE